MAVIFLDNKCFYSVKSIGTTDTILPLESGDVTFICDQLGEGDHTYLTATATGEIIRITCQDGNIMMVRAQGGSNAKPVPAGDCFCFKVNKPIIDDYIDIDPPDIIIPEIELPCETMISTDTPEYIEIIAPVGDDCTWKVNIKSEAYECWNNGCEEPEEECPACPECVLGNGVYENATITVIDGKVCAITNGKNIVYTGGSCCNCSNCSSEEESV